MRGSSLINGESSVFIPGTISAFEQINPHIFLLEMYDPDTLSALSVDQIDNYFRHIELPHEYWPQNSPSLESDLLSVLQVYHLSTIPYGNLALHYSKDVEISLDLNVIYQKFVDKKRGGYCMEKIYSFTIFCGSSGLGCI